jgi:hypothetical protein
VSWYQIFVIDDDGCTLCNTEESSLKAAKNSARETERRQSRGAPTISSVPRVIA